MRHKFLIQRHVIKYYRFLVHLHLQLYIYIFIKHLQLYKNVIIILFFLFLLVVLLAIDKCNRAFSFFISVCHHCEQAF